MTKYLLLAVSALAMSACPSSKVTWTTHDAGPITVDFPCTPSTAAAVTKCMRPDGAEYALEVVEKGLPADQELAQLAEYAKAIPKGEVQDVSQFPVKWREVRQFGTFDFQVYYLDGKEYSVRVQYSAEKAPATVGEFFTRPKVK
jgi:hypothetical protein